MDGIINVFKPAGMTSMNVISKVRRIIGEKKVGHTGTLDPDVTGVLPIFAGKATRAIHYVQNVGKTYEAELVLGAATTTQDASGEVLSSMGCTADDEEITSCIMSFVRSYNQIPPMYSAKKVQGKKLCDLARKGIEVERKEHPVEIYSIKIHSIARETTDSMVKVKLSVDCSRGTYIRTLCADIGEKLACGGYMSWLQRSRSGTFYISDAVSLEELENAMASGMTEKVVAKTESAFKDCPTIEFSGIDRVDLLNGKTLSLSRDRFPGLTEGLTVLYDKDKIFVGLCIVAQSMDDGGFKVKMERQFLI